MNGTFWNKIRSKIFLRKLHLEVVAVSAATLLFIFTVGYVSSDNSGKGRGGRPQKEKNPVTFSITAQVLDVDEGKKVMKGLGKIGSRTGRELLYEELEYDLKDVPIEDLYGNSVSLQELNNADIVFIHGFKYRDGTFQVRKIVVEE